MHQAYQTHADVIWPLRTAARLAVPMLMDPTFGLGGHASHRRAAAACRLMTLAEVTHKRPPWAITSVVVKGAAVEVTEEVVHTTPFATLLRDTVRTMLIDHDVRVTDWHNARDLPLAAVAPMSEDKHTATPRSLTLMAGPIDCRISPTGVNQLAVTKPIEWFKKNLISPVPWGHPGAGRRVYPGFVQLSAFMSMNKERHVAAFRDHYSHILTDEFEKTEVTRTFYEEYLAVAGLDADFYLETVKRVFQDHVLPQGELTLRGRTVKPAAIRHTALLTVEGERDDICAVGQTLAAQDLCTGLRPWMRAHHVQPGVGHCGVFSGRRWQNHICPVVRDVIQVSR